MTECPYEFAAMCNVKHVDPVSRLLSQIGVKSSPILLEVLRSGFTAMAKTRKYRLLLEAFLEKHDPARLKREAEIAADLDRKLTAANVKATNELYEKLNGALKEFEQSILQKWLVLGTTPIGEATREFLELAASHEEERSDELGKNAIFYRRVADKLPRGKRVSDVMTARQVEQIKSSVFAPNKLRVVAV